MAMDNTGLYTTYSQEVVMFVEIFIRLYARKIFNIFGGHIKKIISEQAVVK